MLNELKNILDQNEQIKKNNQSKKSRQKKEKNIFSPMHEVYFNAVYQYIKEYGQSTIILMEVGDFYEMYSFTSSNNIIINDINYVCDEILHMKIATKSTDILGNNLKMAGFPSRGIDMIINNLVDNSYTIIIIDQYKKNTPDESDDLINEDEPGKGKSKEEFERKVSRIITSGTYVETNKVIDNDKNKDNQDNHNIISLFIQGIKKESKLENYSFNCGLSIFDVSTNNINLIEFYYNTGNPKKIVDDLYKTFKCYNVKELSIFGYQLIDFNIIEEYFTLDSNRDTWIDYKIPKINIKEIKTQEDKIMLKIPYHEEVLNKVYFTNNTNVDVITHLDLEYYNLGRQSFIFLLDYIYKVDDKILYNLEKPKLINENNYLILENNAVRQLDLISKETSTNLLKVIDYTNTSMGYRLLKNRILYPFNNPKDINQQYKNVSDYNNYHSIEIKENVNKLLKQINDMERLNKQIYSGKITTYHLYKWYNSLNKINEIFNLLITNSDNDNQDGDYNNFIENIKTIIEYMNTRINIELLEKFTLSNVGKNNDSQIEQSDQFDDDNDSQTESQTELQIENDTNDLNLNNFTFIKSEANIKLKEYFNKIEENYNSLIKIQNELNNIIKNQLENKKKTVKTVRKTTRKITKTTIKSKEIDEKYIILMREKNTNNYYFHINNTNYNLLVDGIKDNNLYENKESISYLNFKKLKAKIKISSIEIEKTSYRILSYEKKIKKKTKEVYYEILKEISDKYGNILNKITQNIAEIDVIQSTLRLKEKAYYEPEIISNENNESFIKAQSIRNPITESIIKQIYVPNDVLLGTKNETSNISFSKGLLLYGTNSGGKSTLIRSVALNIILAQAGLYCSAKSFQYYPYTKLFTRIGNTDSQKHSSNEIELFESSSIINRADKNTFILLDELVSSTEHESAVSISYAMLDALTRSGSTFMFATHLHDLYELEEFNEELADKIDIYYIHTEIKNKLTDNVELVRHRKLIKGIPPEKLYGLEIASYILKDNKDFLKTAQRIRDKITNKPDHFINTKVSHFNPNHIMNECSECGSKENLQTHHLREQHLANSETKLIEHFHKNHTGNLTTLCEKCHKDHHNK